MKQWPKTPWPQATISAWSLVAMEVWVRQTSTKTYFLCSFSHFPAILPIKLFKNPLLRHDIRQSSLTSWILHQTHGSIIGHLRVIIRPTKKFYFLPARSRNQMDRQHWSTYDNQLLKLQDDLTSIDACNSPAIKAPYAVEWVLKVGKDDTWLFDSQNMLWCLLNAVNDPLSCNGQLKCNHGIKACNSPPSCNINAINGLLPCNN